MSSDSVSALAYIFQLHPTTLVEQELEDVLLWTYQSLNEVRLEELLPLLHSMETNRFILVGNEYKLFIRDPWWCQLVVVSCLKHCPDLKKDEDISGGLILQKSLELFRSHRRESIHLLKLITLLPVWNWKDIVAGDLLTFVQIVGLSPFGSFKRYTEEIGKRALICANHEQTTNLLQVDFFPIRGLPISELRRYFQKPNVNLQQIISRIIELFANNIENREGGALYKVILGLIGAEIQAWTVLVWPQFFVKFQAMTPEGEFFQSLLKYWIPQSVATYKMTFYRFVAGTPLGDIFKAHVLLEVKRKFLLPAYSENDLLFLNRLFSQEATRALAFQITCRHIKSAVIPTAAELLLVRQYLHVTSGVLDQKDVEALRAFLIHIGDVLASARVPESVKHNLGHYLMQLTSFAKAELRNGRRGLGAQILRHLYHVSTELENCPTASLSNLFGQLNSADFRSSLEQALLSTEECSEDLRRLAVLLLPEPQTINSQFLFGFIDAMSSALSIQALNSVKNVAAFIASTNSNRDTKANGWLQANLEELLVMLFQSTQNFDLQGIFKTALILEALNQLPTCPSAELFSKWMTSVYFPAVARMLLEKRFDMQKSGKVMEALYINLCQYFLKKLQMWTVVDYPRLLEVLLQVIECSSLRRPTTISADLLKHAIMTLDQECPSDSMASRNCQMLANLKLELLHRTLCKLEDASPAQNLTIRRNPESRLILHAICLSDYSRQKTLLNTILKHLLHLLSDKASSDATLSAALHCTEALISDNRLYDDTIPYASTLILQCIDHFENQNWVVRNACVQLQKALIDRFMGVITGPNNRSRSISDLFQLFPHLAARFFTVLTKVPLTGSALAVMQFFCESQVKMRPFPSRLYRVTRESFLQIFTMLIKCRSDVYGVFAARAFVSLCFPHDIPQIVQHVVAFITRDFRRIRGKHVLRNFLILLEELLDKYEIYMLDKRKTGQHCRMYKSLQELRLFLQKLDMPQLFDCMLVKIRPFESAMAILQEICLDLSNYRHRLWMNNYLPLFILSCSSKELSKTLQLVLAQDLSEGLQEKVLSVFLHRYIKSRLPEGQSTEILNILILRAVSLRRSSKYLLRCYFKVLLLMFESSKLCSVNSQVLESMRQDYDKVIQENPYKTFIFHLALSRASEKSRADEQFAKKACLVQVEDCEDFIEDLSRMLKYFYQNSASSPNRKEILTMALRLLVLHGTWHFISFASKKRIPTALYALEVILNYHFLKRFFKNDQLAFQFVNESYASLVKHVSSVTVDIGDKTFYAVEQDVFVTVSSLNRTVTKFLRDFYTVGRKGAWSDCWSKVANKTLVGS